MSLGQISKNQIDVSRVAGDQPPECDVLDVHAVLLVNYVRPHHVVSCLLYTSPSPRDQRGSRMPSSA